MQTYLQFKNKIKARLFPAREAISLQGPHDAAFQAAMLDLQKWVPCLKQFNVSVWESADRNWDNAKTVINAPYGRIRRIYTVAGGLDRWRDRVYYRSATYDDVECWARRLYGAITPANLGLTVLPFGLKVEEAASDCPYGRAQVGIWAINRHRLYIAPWLQTTETLIVEWDGEKTFWTDNDGVDENYWRPDVEAAVEYFVGFRHALWYGDRTQAPELLALYEKARADLMYWCREYTRQQESVQCGATGGGGDIYNNGNGSGTGPVQGGGGSTDDDDDPTTDTGDADHVLFNAVGDMGDPQPNEALVADAIESDDPELFIALGDNSYNGDYPADFGVNYQWAIDSNRLAVVPGNHDWDIDDTLAAYKAYFASFISNNGNNYEKVVGPIHFLFYDSDTRFADGIDASSTQAEWLKVKLLLSTARWKIVIMHRPPFSSDAVHGSDTDLQLPFAAWGAHAVIAGHSHDYERITVDGVTYIVVGTGGRPLYAFDTPVTGSEVRITGTYGRLIGEADCDTLTLTFRSVAGDDLDSVVITDDGSVVTPTAGDSILTDDEGNILVDGDGNILTG